MENKKHVISTKYRISQVGKNFNNYFEDGGFPAYLKNGNKDYLKTLFHSILYRDVMVRNKLTAEKEMLEMVYYLASNVARLASYNKLAKTIGIKNATTIRNYILYLQNTYLIYIVSKFDYSVKVQVQNSKKIYFIDNALVKTLGFQFSEEKGRLLENIVFNELLRHRKQVFYFQAKGECDFIVRSGSKIENAIQVSYTFESENTKKGKLMVYWKL